MGIWKGRAGRGAVELKVYQEQQSLSWRKTSMLILSGIQQSWSQGSMQVKGGEAAGLGRGAVMGREVPIYQARKCGHYLQTREVESWQVA